MIDNLNWKNSESVLINNIETSAIIEDADSTLTYFADKYIVSKYKIATGDIVEYARIKYLVISQIDRNIEGKDEKEYNYKARMRQADYSIKFIIDGELIEVPTIIEGQRFDIIDEKIISLSNDKIIVTIKDDIEIEKEMRFIKLKQPWKISGIDRTRKGLIILHCDVDIFNTEADDMENEIANRYIIENGKKIDRLATEPEIPTEPELNPSGYTYTITAKTVYPSDPDDEIYWNDTVIYTVHKFDNDVEVDGNFTFEVYQQNIKTKEWIQPSSISEVTNTTNNTINIKAIELKQGYIKLVATDTETNQIAIEKQIKIRGIM